MTSGFEKALRHKGDERDYVTPLEADKPCFANNYPCVCEVGINIATVEVRASSSACVWYRVEEVGTAETRREPRCHAASWESTNANQIKPCILGGLAPNTHYCVRVMLLPDENDIKDLLGSGVLQPFGERSTNARLNRLLLRSSSELLWFTTCPAHPQFLLPPRLEPLTGASQVRVLRFPVDRPCRVYYATVDKNAPTPSPLELRNHCGPLRDKDINRTGVWLEDCGWSDVEAGHVRIMIQRNPKDDMRDVVIVAEIVDKYRGRAGTGIQPQVSRMSPAKKKPEVQEHGRRVDAHLLHCHEAGDAYQWAETAMTVLDKMHEFVAAAWQPLDLPFTADPSWGENAFEGRNWLIVGQGLQKDQQNWQVRVNDDEGLAVFLSSW